MVVSPLFELLFSSKTILQQRVPCLLTPHKPETTITLREQLGYRISLGHVQLPLDKEVDLSSLEGLALYKESQIGQTTKLVSIM
jgi:hypothetical protein